MGRLLAFGGGTGGGIRVGGGGVLSVADACTLALLSSDLTRASAGSSVSPNALSMTTLNSLRSPSALLRLSSKSISSPLRANVAEEGTEELD